MLHVHAAPKLASLTSLRLGGEAVAEITISALEDLDSLPETLEKLGGRPIMLGGGTNILAAEGTLPLVLVRCALHDAPTVMGEDAKGNLFVRVSASMKLPRLLAWCQQAGLGGLESMTGIPGTVGGAVAGNAGAQGTDMGAHVVRVNVFVPGKGLSKLFACDMTFGYRSLRIPEEGDFQVITGVVLALRPLSRESLRLKARACMAQKIQTQPLRDWSAGCVFKNPPAANVRDGSLSAGKLLDEAGFRGKRLGGMRFSSLHANFLVNEGSGSAGAAFDLIHAAQEAVWQKHGVALEPEVKLWTC